LTATIEIPARPGLAGLLDRLQMRVVRRAFTAGMARLPAVAALEDAMNIAWGGTWFWNIGACLAVVEIGPCLGGKVGGNRPDDPWVGLLELAQDRSIECR
jgi:hypothetical protein